MVMVIKHSDIGIDNSNENKKEGLFPSILNGVKKFFKESIGNILNRNSKVVEETNIINSENIITKVENKEKKYRAPVSILNENYQIEEGKVFISNDGSKKEINFIDLEGNQINNIISIERVNYYITESYYITTNSGSYVVSINKDEQGKVEFQTKVEFNNLNGERIVSNISFEDRVLTFGNFDGKGKVLTNLFSNNNFNNGEYLENNKGESIEIFNVFRNKNIVYIISKDNLVYEYKGKSKLKICNDNKVYEHIIRNNYFYENSEITDIEKITRKDDPNSFVYKNSQRLIDNSCIGYIRNNVIELKRRFPKIDFDGIIEGKNGVYDYKKDQLSINGIIFGNRYIESEEVYGSNPNKLTEVDKYYRNNICEFIAKNIDKLLKKFENIDFNKVIKYGSYDKGKDELVFNNITVGKGYIKYRDNLDKKPNFYLLDNPEKVVIKLHSSNLTSSPDLEVSFDNGKNVNLSFQNYSTYLRFLNFIQSKIYIYIQKKGIFKEVLVNKITAIRQLEEVLDPIEEKDFHFNNFEIIT